LPAFRCEATLNALKKRSLIVSEGERRSSAQCALLSHVAAKALALERTSEAESLIAPAVAELIELVDKAKSAEDWEHIARIYAHLAKLLPSLEAATGKRWTGCLDFVKERLPKSMLPPRGQA
jgi:hypothetical protein